MKDVLFEGRVVGHVDQMRMTQECESPCGDLQIGMVSTRPVTITRVELTITLVPDGATTDLLGALQDSTPLVLGSGDEVGSPRYERQLRARIEELEKQLAVKAMKLVLPELDDA